MIGGMAQTLMVGAAAIALSGDIGHSHDVTIDHHRGAVEAQYRSRVTIEHRQVGAVTPGGVPSTLRCAWQANVVVERDARHPRGTAARTFTRDGVLSGSRPGWCAGARAGIAQEVARRGDELRGHLLAAAEGDRETLAAEIDRLHDPAQRG